ncbi:MAG: hypothetical protein ACJA07_001497 [Rhodococcus sp. (in: high G+C Gram-positive bacteria)]|jgi:hypothetical protein
MSVSSSFTASDEFDPGTPVVLREDLASGGDDIITGEVHSPGRPAWTPDAPQIDPPDNGMVVVVWPSLPEGFNAPHWEYASDLVAVEQR